MEEVSEVEQLKQLAERLESMDVRMQVARASYFEQLRQLEERLQELVDHGRRSLLRRR